MNKIKEMISTVMGFQITLEYPYKLCDYKPAYGLIFNQYTQGYDFWGQTDIDLIYGNIRRFMTEELLDNFDYISVRHDYTSGCFALYRNIDIINTIFKRSKDYKKVFTESKHYCFDECNFVWDKLTSGKSIFEINTEIESFTHVIRRAAENNEIKAFFDFIVVEGVPGKIKFCKGTITYKNLYEAILYHLYWFKRVCQNAKEPKVVSDVYTISSKKIYMR